MTTYDKLITEDSYFLFSGGEVHCKINKIENTHLVVVDYTMNGFMALAEMVEVLRRGSDSSITAHYPYFPYARQDRVMQPDESFSLKVFCNLVNNLNLEAIVINDPHSDVTPALLNNCTIIPQWETARKIIPESYFNDEEVVFVSPDAGAYKKVSKLINNDHRIAIGVKNRDATGKITNTAIYSPKDLKDRTFIMVDDICDGGRTFIELAKVLKAGGAKKVILYVTHGIFSQGLDILKQHIDFIYTTNSFPNEDIEDFMEVLEII